MECRDDESDGEENVFVEVVVIGETLLLPKEEGGDCNPKECAVVAMSAAVSDDSGDMRVLVMVVV